MNFADKTFGRLGNRLFQSAFCYAYARENGIDHYYQDPKYFAGYEDEIRVFFGEGIVPDERIAIHVRRGDYVNNPFYVDLTSTDYYFQAMQHFPEARFLVFSDNIPWCKDYFVDPKFDYSEGHSAEEDLKLMAGCRGMIMANSSLSWWGAFLGETKKVIYPKNWYADGIQRTVCLPNWIPV